MAEVLVCPICLTPPGPNSYYEMQTCRCARLRFGVRRTWFLSSSKIGARMSISVATADQAVMMREKGATRPEGRSVDEFLNDLLERAITSEVLES